MHISNQSKYPLPIGSITNPNFGDIRKAKELRIKDGGYRIWLACSQCGNGHWLQYSHYRARITLCALCANRNKWRAYSEVIAFPPIIGEVRRGRQIGKSNTMEYTYTLCDNCQQPFWRSSDKRLITHLCKRCVAKFVGEKKRKYFTCVRCEETIWAKGNIPKHGLCSKCYHIVHPPNQYIEGCVTKGRLITITCPKCGQERIARQCKRKTNLCRYCYSHMRRKFVPTPQGTVEHPILGDIRKGDEINHTHRSYYIWAECLICHIGRWTMVNASLKPQRELCYKCAYTIAHKGKVGEKAPNWRGGTKAYNERKKIEALSHYTVGGSIKCANPFHMHRTPIVDLDLLTIDHINGGGFLDRKIDSNTYRRLKREGYPSGYQILCWNCQWKKSIVNDERRKAKLLKGMLD